VQLDEGGFDPFTAVRQYRQGLSDMPYEQRIAMMQEYAKRLRAKGHQMPPHLYQQHTNPANGSTGVRG